MIKFDDLTRDDYIDIQREVIVQATRLPYPGTPVAELSDRDKFAIAFAAGAPYTSEMQGNYLVFRTTVPVGIADRGDGGYIVAIGSMGK